MDNLENDFCFLNLWHDRVLQAELKNVTLKKNLVSGIVTGEFTIELVDKDFFKYEDHKTYTIQSLKKSGSFEYKITDFVIDEYSTYLEAGTKMSKNTYKFHGVNKGEWQLL